MLCCSLMSHKIHETEHVKAQNRVDNFTQCCIYIEVEKISRRRQTQTHSRAEEKYQKKILPYSKRLKCRRRRGNTRQYPPNKYDICAFELIQAEHTSNLTLCCWSPRHLFPFHDLDLFPLPSHSFSSVCKCNVIKIYDYLAAVLSQSHTQSTQFSPPVSFLILFLLFSRFSLSLLLLP